MAGRRLINRALKNIEAQMNREAQDARKDWERRGAKGPNFAAGLASEGYMGGYRDALNDALLAMNGVTPNRNRWWEK